MAPFSKNLTREKIIQLIDENSDLTQFNQIDRLRIAAYKIVQYKHDYSTEEAHAIADINVKNTLSKSTNTQVKVRLKQLVNQLLDIVKACSSRKDHIRFKLIKKHRTFKAKYDIEVFGRDNFKPIEIPGLVDMPIEMPDEVYLDPFKWQCSGFAPHTNETRITDVFDIYGNIDQNVLN